MRFFEIFSRFSKFFEKILKISKNFKNLEKISKSLEKYFEFSRFSKIFRNFDFCSGFFEFFLIFSRCSKFFEIFRIFWFGGIGGGGILFVLRDALWQDRAKHKLLSKMLGKLPQEVHKCEFEKCFAVGIRSSIQITGIERVRDSVNQRSNNFYFLSFLAFSFLVFSFSSS